MNFCIDLKLITLKLECIVPVLLVKWYELVECVWNFNSHDRNIGSYWRPWCCVFLPDDTSHRLNRCWLILIVVIALGLLEANELYDEQWQFRRKWSFSYSVKVFSVVCDNFTAHCKLAICVVQTLGSSLYLSYVREICILCVIVFVGGSGVLNLLYYCIFLH